MKTIRKRSMRAAPLRRAIGAAAIGAAAIGAAEVLPYLLNAWRPELLYPYLLTAAVYPEAPWAGLGPYWPLSYRLDEAPSSSLLSGSKQSWRRGIWSRG